MKMFQRAIYLSIITLIFLNISQNVFAEDYVLPYPSFMPGNKIYKITRFFDSLESWWYWGNIASFKYHLKLADKYLVEAKTLLEYKQYQLGLNALKRSDAQVPHILESLHSAQKEKEDIKILRKTMISAMNAHIGILKTLSSELPATYLWEPEKSKPEMLDLAQSLNDSLVIRKRLFE